MMMKKKMNEMKMVKDVADDDVCDDSGGKRSENKPKCEIVYLWRKFFRWLVGWVHKLMIMTMMMM